MKYIATVNDQKYIIEIGHEGQIQVDGQEYDVDFEKLSDGGILSLLLNNRSLEAIFIWSRYRMRGSTGWPRNAVPR